MYEWKFNTCLIFWVRLLIFLIVESPESSIHHDQSDHFEGKIVFALAETLNSMNSSQINQMAERIIQRWKQEEEDAFNSKMKKLIRAYEKSSFMQAQKALNIWRWQSREYTLTTKFENTIAQLENTIKSLQNKSLMNEIEKG